MTVGMTVDRGVALVTLSDPPANTYSYEMMRALDAVILDARMRREKSGASAAARTA